jgi:hypothetical protein
MHTFCYDCLVEAVRHSPHCPIDRSSLSMDDFSPANPIVKHVCLISHASATLLIRTDARL